jgi:LEA14-like dessication related protein
MTKRTKSAMLAVLAMGGAAFATVTPGPKSAGLPTPTAEITRFQVEAISLRDVTFLFELSVQNPYPLELPIDGMTLDFSVEGSKVFTAASQGSFRVKANAKQAKSFTVTLSYDAIFKLVKDYAAKEYLATAISGKLVIKIPTVPLMPGLPKDVSFDFKLDKKIPAIKPQVAITGFKVTPPSAEQVRQAVAKAAKGVDPGKALSAITDVLAGKKPESGAFDPTQIDVPISVAFTVEIKNEAKAALGFSKLEYELWVNGERLVVGASSSVTKSGQATLVTVTNTFSTKQLSKGVNAVFSAKKGDFKIVGSASLKLPDEIRKEPIALRFTESGTFSFK